MKCRYFFLCISAFFLIFNFYTYSESTEFYIAGFETVGDDPQIMAVDWDEKIIGSAPPTKYNHKLARIASIFSEVSYCDVLYKGDTNELTRCYQAIGIKKEDIDLHYNVNYSDPFWGNDQCAYSIASKKINSAKGPATLIFVTVRGTPLNANEWISNINISDRTKHSTPIHEGFSRAASKVHASLIFYILRHKIDIESTYVLITGHSRGAAVSNVLAADLYREEIFNKNNIYCYTFACPNVTSYEYAKNPEYDFIWNIVSAEDIVPTVPMNRNNWAYTKYGRVLTLVNAWNTDYKKYKEYYLPEVNKNFRRLLARDYCPFETGSFIPEQITSFATSFNKSIEVFYSSLTGIHDIGQAVFWKLFPEKTATESEERAPQEKGNSRIANIAYNYVNKKTNGSADYIMNSFIDMHAMETYFSFMLAFDENEIFSDMGSSQVIISGQCNFIVYSQDGQIAASGKDGAVNLWNTKAPLAAMQTGPDRFALGFPANHHYTVIITRDCILHSPVAITIEHFDVSGVLKESCNREIHFFNKNSLYKFDAGQETLSSHSITMTKLNRSEEKLIKQNTKILKNDKTMFVPEIYSDISGAFGGGVHYGKRNLYATALFDYNVYNIGKALSLSTGIGHQENLWGPVVLDAELLSKFVWNIDELHNETAGFSVVPSMRYTFSLRPVRRFTLFSAAVFDFHIDGFNDNAFDDDVRKNNIKSLSVSSEIDIAPSIQFGIKL